MSCGCSICEAFSNTSDNLTEAPHQSELEEGRQNLHNYYGDKVEMTDEQENQIYEKLTKFAKEDGLHDLRKTLQSLYDSSD